MLNRFKMIAAATAVMALGATAAHAGPIAIIYSFDGSNYFTISSSTSGSASTPDNYSLTNNGTTFMVQFTATGTGTGSTPAPQPNFFTNTFTTSSNGAGTIYLAAIESGLTATNVSAFTVGFANNGVSSIPVTESFYVGQTISATMAPFVSSTMSPGATLTQTIAAPTLQTGYSVAEQFVLRFTGAGQQVNATISEVASFPSAVPEPMSLALLGTGLVATGMIRRRRR